MPESPESEVTRILTSWPEGDRLAGVLRVVRAMQERGDETVVLVRRLDAENKTLRAELTRLLDVVAEEDHESIKSVLARKE